MDNLMRWGIEWIVTLQSLSTPLLTQAMEVFTFLGSELFFLVLMPAVLWCYDASIGVRTGLALLTSASFNGILKLVFRLPRPFWIDSRVQPWTAEASYGLPSGHAQNAIVVWGYLADRLRRSWVTAAAFILIVGISISRMYLGVHFPTDVLGGWIVGGVLLAILVRLEAPVSRWLRERPVSMQLLAAVVASLGLLAVGAVILGATEPPTGAWPPELAREAHTIRGLVSSTGALLGVAVGAVLLSAWGKFDGRSGGTLVRFARFALGLAGVIVLYAGLGALLPDSEVWRYLRYATLGLWGVYGAPRVFVALGLDR